MSTHLITGFAGKEHITSADQGSFNAAVMGGGEFVMERGEQFRCQVISNNKVRIYDGDALMQGRHIIIDRNTYEETTHENGTQGYKRIDLIVLTYEKNAVSSVESVKLEVIKGAPAESNPTVPEYITGDILNSGEAKNQMPLYKIPFDGLSIGEPVKLFSTVPTLETMKIEVDERVSEKIEELDDAFSELEAGIDERFDAAGKPLSSSASDWALIQNYGQYSADAKTVGVELSKKVDKISGKGLSTNDYTTAEKNKLSKLENRTAISDLLAEADLGTQATRIVVTSSTTLNTPYKDGLTDGLTAGVAMINMTAMSYGQIIYFESGGTRVFIRRKNNGTWGEWIKITLDDQLSKYALASDLDKYALASSLNNYALKSSLSSYTPLSTFNSYLKIVKFLQFNEGGNCAGRSTLTIDFSYTMKKNTNKIFVIPTGIGWGNVDQGAISVTYSGTTATWTVTVLNTNASQAYVNALVSIIEYEP